VTGPRECPFPQVGDLLERVCMPCSLEQAGVLRRDFDAAAVVVHSFDRPLQVEGVPVPEPGAEQALVRIEAIEQVLDGSAPPARVVFRL